jgi:uncharacterized protein (DUF2141 family)
MIYPVLILILNSFNINYSLNINIENINPSKGQLMIAVYNSKQLYMKTEKAFSKQILKLNGKKARNLFNLKICQWANTRLQSFMMKIIMEN